MHKKAEKRERASHWEELRKHFNYAASPRLPPCAAAAPEQLERPLGRPLPEEDVPRKHEGRKPPIFGC